MFELHRHCVLLPSMLWIKSCVKLFEISPSLVFLLWLFNPPCFFCFVLFFISRTTDRSSTFTWCTRATSCLSWSSRCSVTQSSRAGREKYGRPTWTTALRRYNNRDCARRVTVRPLAAGCNCKRHSFCCRWRCQRVSKHESQSCVRTVTWTYGQGREEKKNTSCLLNPGNTIRDMRALWMHYFRNVGFLQPKIYKCLFPVV